MAERRITATSRSKSFAPAHLNAFIKKERPIWARDLKRTRECEREDEEEQPEERNVALKRRRVSNRATDVARLRDESSDLQARIERFKLVAHEAAAKAQSINSGASTLRANRRLNQHYIPTPSSSYISASRPSAWSSISYRCVQPPRLRPQPSPQQLETKPTLLLTAPPAPPPLSLPVPLIKSESTLSLGDFIASIPGEYRTNTLRRCKVPPASPCGHEGEKAKVKEKEAILSSPALRRKLEDVFLAQRLEGQESTEEGSASDEAKTDEPAVSTEDLRQHDEPVVHTEASEKEQNNDQQAERKDAETKHVEREEPAEEELQSNKKAELKKQRLHKDDKYDEAGLKRKDKVVRKKKASKPERDESSDQLEAKPGKGRKRKAFLAILGKKNKKLKREKEELQQQADQERERENVANEKKRRREEAIDQEKLNQRVEYIKRQIEARYGVVRRESKRSGKRVRIQEPTTQSAPAAPQPSAGSVEKGIAPKEEVEPKQVESDELKPLDEPTTTTTESSSDGMKREESQEGKGVEASCGVAVSSGGGRRRRLMTLEEVTNEMVSAIAVSKKPLIKQRGLIFLDRENIKCDKENVSPNHDSQPTKAEEPTKKAKKGTTKAQGCSESELKKKKKRKTKKVALVTTEEGTNKRTKRTVVKEGGSCINPPSSSSALSSSSSVLTSSAGGRGVNLPTRRPLQPRNV